MTGPRGVYDPRKVFLPPDLASRGRVLGGRVEDGSDPFAQGPESAFPPTQRSLLAFPPEIYNIPDAVEFRRRLVFTSPGVGTIEPAGLTFELPPQNVGVIRNYGLGLLNILPTTDVSWQLLVDGQVWPGYENLGFFPGNVPRVTQDEDVLVYLPQGAVISWRFINRDGAAYTAYVSYGGASWTPEAASRWAGETAGGDPGA